MAEIFGGLLGGIGALAGAGSAQEAAMVQLMNLRFQQQQAQKQFDLATATRTDAFGNTQRYNAALNRWETVLSPEQQQIVSAQQNEQLKELTQDAQRQRTLQEQAFQRAQEAIPDYNKALAGFRFDEAPSADADANKLFQLKQLAGQTKTGQDTQAVGRTLLRQGRGDQLPILLKTASDANGQNIGANLLSAHEEGRQQNIQDLQARQSRYLPILAQLQQTLAGGGGSIQPRFSTTPQELSALQQQQSQQIQNAIQSGGSAVGNAFNGLATSIANTAPDIKGIASMISAFKSNNRGGNNSAFTLVPDAGTGTGDASAGFTDFVPDQQDFSSLF